MPELARRLERVPVAATIQMTVRARALRAAGHDVIALTIGEPDFASPPHAIAAAHAAALRGETKYPPHDGTLALKQAIRRKFLRDNALDFAPDEIAVTNGGKQSIFNAFMATIDDGDEVVIPAPYWGAYPLMARFAGAAPVIVSCAQEHGFRPQPAALDAAITPRTKWLVLNFPNNPTGAAATAEQIAAIAAVMRRHPHVWIMSDDMYEHLTYDGFAFHTIAQVAPDLRPRVLTINGVSKTYAMTGWRIGYAGGPAALIRAMANVQGQATSGVSTVGQAAAAAALDGPQDQVLVQRTAYRARRDRLVDGLNACAGIVCPRPEGAFYVFPNVAGCLGRRSAGGRRIDTDEDFAAALLEEAHVAVVSGGGFGMSPYVRLSYAASEDVLAEACRRVQTFCDGLA
jgi:aspartate aminotransferase